MRLLLLTTATGGPLELQDCWYERRPDRPIGVTTDDSGRVTQLSLNFNNLNGELPSLSSLDSAANVCLNGTYG